MCYPLELRDDTWFYIYIHLFNYGVKYAEVWYMQMICISIVVVS